MRTRRTSMTALLLALACACSSPPAPASRVEELLSTSSTAALTTRPSSSDTSAVRAPTSSSVAATTTTTTAAPVVDHQQLVHAAYESYMAGYWACLRSPNDCDPSRLTASESPARRTLTKTVSDMRAANLRVGSDDVGYTVIESISVDPPSGRATVMTCNWDTAVLYGPPARPGGAELVMNNVRETSRFRSVMYLEEGVWRLGEEHGVEEAEGVNTCPPAS